jgi:ABC-type branched-subunit amino acid transport system ATPase component/predicted MFS family arabinose efflux permease
VPEVPGDEPIDPSVAAGAAGPALPGDEACADVDAGSVATIAAGVLADEEARAADRALRDDILFPDEMLPGVNSEPLTMKQGFARGGAFMFVVLTILNSLDELEGAALSVLAPEIRDTFDVSKGALVFIATASSAFFVLGAVPMGWLADRVKRVPIVGVSSILFGGFVVMSGLALNAFMLFWTRFFTGIAKANTIPVHGSLIADNYPIGVRARMSALNNAVGHGFGLAAPVLVAAIAEIAGGLEGWRWSWYLLGLPVAVVGIAAFFMREPPRGQYEKLDVLGQVIEDRTPVPISMEASFERLRRIRTIRSVLIAFCALGFGLFSVPSIQNFYMEEQLGMDGPLERGIIGSLIGVLALPALPYMGRYFDRLYRTDPAKALRLVGILILPSALLAPLQFTVENKVAFVAFGIPQAVLTTTAFAMVGPVLQAVVPYRIRGMGTAYSTMWIFFVGGFLGGIISGFFVDAWGERATMILLSIPTSIVGGLMLVNGARSIRNDLSLVVQELREELVEHERQTESSEVPVLQLANVDFSYGPVQVLFDVNFEVRRGETLALLGTNGAGKSTILRVVSGLSIPERGVVRLNGQTFTYVAPETRARLGIMQLPGGKGVFPSLSVRTNLEISARLASRDRIEQQRRIASVFELFPELAERLAQPAGSMSGGQQQMLALARVLIHEPEILLIDELSLGLAPVVVQRLLEVVDRLKERGQTMLIVEQSLNVALAIADRAIFLEKGEIRFEGEARELAERDDLARAVFFGREGG